MPNIVILDGYTLNPGDLSWEGLKGLGACSVYDRTPPEMTVDRAKDAEIVLTNKTALDRKTLEQLPQLRYVGVLATGYNVVHEAALAGALEEGRIAGDGLDVLCSEPPPAANV